MLCYSLIHSYIHSVNHSAVDSFIRSFVQVGVSRGGQLQATFISSSQSWRVVTERGSVISNQWQYVEVSWHVDKGAYVHIQKRRCHATVDSQTNLSVSVSDSRQASTVYLGSIHQSTTPQSFPQVLIDQLEIWFADRDHVKAFGFLEDG